MSDAGAKEYHFDVDIDIDNPPQVRRFTEAVASAGAELIRAEPPRFTVRVKASSESEAERLVVEALEQRFSSPGVDWRTVGVTRWVDG
jgi:hypothetical protein